MANIALNKPATASSTVAPYEPSRAVDGITNSPSNRWVACQVPAWLDVDLQNNYWVNQWLLSFMNSAGWGAGYAISDFKLQGSMDNNNWFDMDSVVGNTAPSINRTCGPKLARFIRVYITKGLGVNNQVASILDFQASEPANAPYLAGLTLKSNAVNVAFTPAFAQKNFSYSASVTATATSVDVTPTVAVGTIKVNNVSANNGSSINVPLTGASTTITISVTSPDNLMTGTYTVIVTKAVKSANLSGLTVNGIRGALNPAFSSSTMSYTANVAGGVASVTVTPTAEDAQATIKVDTVTVPSGQTSPAVALNVGTNTISIVVTAADNSSSKTYTVVVTRPS